MKRLATIGFFWVAALHAVHGAEFEHAVLGNPADVQPAKISGGLALMGGGGRVERAFRWLVDRAGGGDIVVLKAGPGDADARYIFETVGGCDSVESLTFANRSAAVDPQVLKVLEGAECIFIAGGKQFLYADYWKGTPVASALDRHVREGKPLGGSSAGLAVLGQVCYTAHISARVTSEVALANPFDERLTFESDLLHFDLLRGVVTDSHFSTRKRLGRLITFVARHVGQPGTERLMGIGVDEKTALCLSPEGPGEVFTEAGDGRVWLVLPPADCTPPTRGTPLNCRDYEVVEAGPQSRVQILERRVDNPVSRAGAIVENGVLRLEPHPAGQR